MGDATETIDTNSSSCTEDCSTVIALRQLHLQNCGLDVGDEYSAVLRSGLFDAQFYITKYEDIRIANVDPLKHFVDHGAREKRSPNQWFDANYYRTQFGEFTEDINPLLHYLERGELLGFKPHPQFDPRNYRNLFPVVDQAGVSPLWHLLHFGTKEFIRTMEHRYVPRPPIKVSKPPLRQWIHDPRATLGVNFISPLSRIAGLGASSRGFLNALQTADIPVHIVEWTRGFEHQPVGDFNFKGVQAVQPINIIHMNADFFHVVLNDLRQNGLFRSDQYNIAVWYWELSSFRKEWMPWIAAMDEIWCASSFNVRSVDVVSARPVNLLRPAVIEPAAPGVFARSHFGLSQDSCVFFYSCDLSSRIDRKNPEALIAAFRQEFQDSPHYQLVLKIGSSAEQPASASRVLGAVGDAKNIVLIDRTMSDGELADLIRHSFAYVSPHRSEGLGLTIVEAMLSGCPVIATPHGGSSDFVFDEIARPLQHGMVEIQRTEEPYKRGTAWADPHIADIRRAMRELASSPEAARAMGLRGKAFAERMFSPQATGNAIKQRLQQVWTSGRP